MATKKVKQIKLLPYQAEFVNDTQHRYQAFVGGLGTGKTKSAVYKALFLLQVNKGCNGIGAEPTGPQLAIFTNEMDKTCNDNGIKFTYNGGGRNSPAFYQFNFGSGPQKLWLVSAENWRRTLVGFNCAFAFVDEADTIPNMDEGLAMWNAMNDRVRDPKAEHRVTFATSTPEGFHILHNLFVENATYEKKMYVATTMQNIFLPPSYVQDQLKRYTPQQAEAKIYGKFVNVFGQRVYICFDREANSTKKTLADFPQHMLHIGMDFNVGQMSATISVIDETDNKVYTLEEITGEQTTETLIAAIKRKFPNRYIMVYPDSSGKNSSANSSISSIAMLKKAGFECYFRGNNPSILKERVPAVNAMFRNSVDERRSFVNIDKCPVLVKGLEQQGYKDGKPDKSNGLDHCLDAFGYFMHYRFPVQGKSSARISG